VEHALISLLALNGLRVSEATGAGIEDLGIERDHRTLSRRSSGARKMGPSVRSPMARSSANATQPKLILVSGCVAAGCSAWWSA
jgi:integrase/recombinase XerD